MCNPFALEEKKAWGKKYFDWLKGEREKERENWNRERDGGREVSGEEYLHSDILRHVEIVVPGPRLKADTEGIERERND